VRANLHAARSDASRTSASSASRRSGQRSQGSAVRLATVDEADLHRSSEMERRVDAEWKRFFEQRDLAEKEVKKALEKSQVENEVDSGRRMLPNHAGAHLAVRSSVSKNSTLTPGANGTQDGAASPPAPRHNAAGDSSVDAGPEPEPEPEAEPHRAAQSAAVQRGPGGQAAWTLLVLLATTSRR